MALNPRIFAIAALLWSQAVSAGPDSFIKANGEARAALQAKDYPGYLRSVQALVKLAPGHPSVQFSLARALALNGRSRDALSQLTWLAKQGMSASLRDDDAFKKLAHKSDFIAATKRLDANGAGLKRAKGILWLGQTGGSEGVAWSEVLKSFVFGAPQAILSYPLDGSSGVRRLATSGPMVLGIRPHDATGSLLACVNGPDRSEVIRYEQATGLVRTATALPVKGAQCNDIALIGDRAFVTDSANHAVFVVSSNGVEPLPLTTPVYFPNGIASDPSTRRVYVAHAGGIIVHDSVTATSWTMTAKSTLLGAIDGMVWHEGSLIAVQNQGTATRLLRITPDRRSHTAKVTTLLVGNDFPGRASTVAVAGADAYVLGAGKRPEAEQSEAILVRVGL